MSSTSLAATVANAIAFLTRPLIPTHSATTIIRLQLVLETQLTAFYSSTWHSRLSSRKCLALSPVSLPPRPILAACTASGVQWADWIAALGAQEFELFLEPGVVSVRMGAHSVIVWQADDLVLPAQKTTAQCLIEADNDDDEIFAMINHRVAMPLTAPTPTYATFAAARAESPVSRASSAVSDSSSDSGFSFFSNSSHTSASSIDVSAVSRREKARMERVFVDKSKTVVTKYDGGKTNVLTGGVMLGGSSRNQAPKPTKAARPASSSDADNWRRF